MIRADSSHPRMTKTFFTYSIPCIISMFLTSFITIVDGVFIGWKLGPNGLAAVNLTLPVLYSLLAVTIMVGVGGVTLASQSLGEQNLSRANHYFSFAITISGVMILVAALILRLFTDRIVLMLHAPGIIFHYVTEFLGTMSYFYVFMMLNLTFSMFIRSKGKPQLSLLFGVAGNLFNIVLDYLFIFRLNYGMRGAAFASGLSVLLPFLFGVFYFRSQRSVYKFQRIQYRLADLRQMLFNGSAEFVAQISASITIYIYNWVILKRIGIDGVAALTIVGYISFIQNMILTGIAIGIHPVISYQYGAKNHQAVLALFAIAVKVVLTLGIIFFITALLAAVPIVRLFSGDNRALLQLDVMLIVKRQNETHHLLVVNFWKQPLRNPIGLTFKSTELPSLPFYKRLSRGSSWRMRRLCAKMSSASLKNGASF